MRAIKFVEDCGDIKDEEGKKLCQGIKVGCSILNNLTGLDKDMCTEIAIRGLPCDIKKFGEISYCDPQKFIDSVKEQLKVSDELVSKAVWGMNQWLKSLEKK